MAIGRSDAPSRAAADERGATRRGTHAVPDPRSPPPTGWRRDMPARATPRCASWATGDDRPCLDWRSRGTDACAPLSGGDAARCSVRPARRLFHVKRFVERSSGRATPTRSTDRTDRSDETTVRRPAAQRSAGAPPAVRRRNPAGARRGLPPGSAERSWATPRHPGAVARFGGGMGLAPISAPVTGEALEWCLPPRGLGCFEAPGREDRSLATN